MIFKGFGSGLGSLIIALTVGERLPAASTIGMILALGFVAYGLSIRCYILAQKDLGAAKTSAYYSIAPFLGVAFSMALLGERPGLSFYVALLVMVLATVLIARDTVALQHAHLHSHVHTHAHSHGGYTHTHAHTTATAISMSIRQGDALHTHSTRSFPATTMSMGKLTQSYHRSLPEKIFFPLQRWTLLIRSPGRRRRNPCGRNSMRPTTKN